MKVIEQIINETEDKLKKIIAKKESIIAECMKPFPKREDFPSGLEYGIAYTQYIEDHNKGKYSTKAMGEAMQVKYDAERQLRDVANARQSLRKFIESEVDDVNTM